MDACSRSDLLTTLENLSRGSRDGKKTLHKPLLLLMILARQQQGGSRLATFEELREPFQALLEEFGGPKQDSDAVRYPLWALRNEGIWEVPGGAELPRRSGNKEPKVAAMLTANTTCGFLFEVMAELKADRELAARSASILLDHHFPGSLRAAVSDRVGVKTDNASTPIVILGAS